MSSTMTRTANDTSPLLYVACDIPDGVTLVEWRRRRHEHDRRRRSRFVAAVRRMGGLAR
jgi:hypothetical protein